MKSLYKRITNFSTAVIIGVGTLTALTPFIFASATGAVPPAGTVIVQGNTASGENTEGWMFNRDATTSTPFEFTADQAVIGQGSLYVAPISSTSASDKFVGENFLLSTISAIDTISYDYKIGAGGVSSDYDQIYMNVYANFGQSSPTKFYDCRYNVLASSGSTTNFTTLTFDVDSAYSVTTRGGADPSPYVCPPVPSAMNLSSPNSTIRAFSISVGDTTLGDAGVDAYLDNVIVKSINGTTTYDFEPVIPACSTNDTTFDTFVNGSVNTQKGWSSTGPFDQAIVTNDYGISSFGCKSLRISNAATSGSFGDQTFSYSTSNEAGEADSTSNGKSGGTRVNRYEAQFDIASAQQTVQAGLSVSVSPDRGDGSRMSYLRFEDQADGIKVYFDDVQGGDFVETLIATLSRTAHTIKFVIDYKDGPSNDVVAILIDGVQVHTGTSWEDYYRFDPESAAEQTPRTSDSLLFRVGGTATPANSGKGFLFDNVVITTSDSTIVTPPANGNNNNGGTPPAGNPAGPASDPAAFTGVFANGASVLGAINDTTDDDASQNGESDVEGVSTDDVAAVDTDATDGSIFGLAWYWWLLILAVLAAIIAAIIRRIRTNTEA